MKVIHFVHSYDRIVLLLLTMPLHSSGRSVNGSFEEQNLEEKRKGLEHICLKFSHKLLKNLTFKQILHISPVKSLIMPHRFLFYEMNNPKNSGCILERISRITRAFINFPKS